MFRFTRSSWLRTLPLLLPALLTLPACSGGGGGAESLETIADSSFQLDTTFNAAGPRPGILTTTLGTANDTAQAMALQADGKIVIAGSTWSGTSTDIAVVRYNDDDSLDTTFNAGGAIPGVVTTDIAGTTDLAYAIAIQGDGKIVVAGYSFNFGTSLNEFAIVRYNSDGSLDTSFSASGIARLSPSRGGNQPPTASAGASQNVASGAAVTLTGSVIDVDGTIVSYLWTQTAGPAVTLTNDTTAVASFTAPVVAVNTLLSFQLVVTDNFDNITTVTTSVTVTPAGNQPPVVDTGATQNVSSAGIVTLRGSASDVDGTIASYLWTQTAGPAVTLTNNTTAVATFTAPTVTTKTLLSFQFVVIDDDGATTTATTHVTVLPAGSNSIARAIAIQGTGAIVVAGPANNSADDDIAVIRLTSAGKSDATFGTAGIVIVDVNSVYTGDPAVNDTATAVRLDASNKIVVAGTSNETAAVVRLNSNGSLDTSFGNGVVPSGVSLISGLSQGNALIIQSLAPNAGKLVIGGAAGTGTTDMGLARLDTSGVLDLTFNAAGTVPGVSTAGFLSNRNDVVTSLALQSDGKIVAAGGAASGIGFDFALVRMHADGTLDTDADSDPLVTFGLGGKVSTPIGTSNDAINAIAIQGTGEIIAAGSSWLGNHWIMALARYLPDIP